MAQESSKIPIDRGALQSLRDEISELVDRFARGWSGLPSIADWDPFRGSLPRSSLALALNVDTSESDDAYEISAELPAVDKKDIELTLTDRVLTLKGEKNEAGDETKRNYHLTQRSYGAFQRSFRPGSAKGSLNITLPKSKEAKAKAKKIVVEGG